MTDVLLVPLVFRAVSYMMSTLFYPIITFLLLAVCSSYFAVTSVYLTLTGVVFLH